MKASEKIHKASFCLFLLIFLIKTTTAELLDDFSRNFNASFSFEDFNYTSLLGINLTDLALKRAHAAETNRGIRNKRTRPLPPGPAPRPTQKSQPPPKPRPSNPGGGRGNGSYNRKANRNDPPKPIPRRNPTSRNPTPRPKRLPTPWPTTRPIRAPTAPPTKRRTHRPNNTPITPAPTKQIPTTLELVQVGNTIHGDEEFDFSGNSISLSKNGRRLAIGVGRHDPASGVDAGQVRIFQRAAYNEWVKLGSFIDGISKEEGLGLDVSLSGDGNWLAVSDLNPGEATMYKYVGSSWVQKGNSVEGTQIQLSNDGSRLVVGGYMFGQLYEYDKRSKDWVKLGNELYQTNLTHVDISGNGRRFVLSCPEASEIYSSGGVVRILEYDASSGIRQVGQILFGDEYDLFGWSISMSYDGNVLAVGSWGGNYARIFKYDEVNDRWGQIGRDIVGDDLDEFEFGYSISLADDGNRVAIGSPLYDNKKGRIAVYRLKNGSWEFADQAVGLSTDDWEGEDIAFSPEGDYVAVSAVLSDDKERNTVDAGHVRIFECVVEPI